MATTPGKTPDKTDLRREMRRKIDLLTPAVRAAASADICNRLLKNPRIADAAFIAVYMALPSEPDLTEFIQARLSRGRSVLLPRIVGKPADGAMEFRVVHNWQEDFQRGALGIREPTKQCPLHTGPVDVVLVPGLAFDRKKNRLGKGAGHYDRWLSHTKVAYTVGIGFLCQRIDAVPTNKHDVPMREIVLA